MLFSDFFLFHQKELDCRHDFFSVKTTNIDCAVIIWPVYGRLRLSFADALLTVRPIPSHALLGGEEVPFACYANVSGVMCDVDEIELVFVLPRAAVRKIVYFAQPRYQLLYFRNEAS